MPGAAAAQWAPLPSPCPALGWTGGPPPTATSRERVKGVLREAYLRTALLGLRDARVAIPESPRAVIVCAGGNLGGAIIALPLISALRRRFPSTHLAVVGNTAIGLDVIRFAGLGDSYHQFSDASLRNRRAFAVWTRGLRALRALGPALLVANWDARVEHLLVPLRIPVRVGHVGTRATGGEMVWGGHFNVPVPVATGDNWLASYRALAERLGIACDGAPRLSVPEAMRRWAVATLRARGLQPGEWPVAVQAGVWGVQHWKQWPLPRVAAACAVLARDHGFRPVLLGTHAQRPAVEEIRGAAPDIAFIDIVGDTSLGEAAALLAACSATITNDSGLMHLSAAVGTPTVAVYGMTDPAITWCEGDNARHRVVRRTDCRPCYSLPGDVLAGCEHKGCLTALPVEPVVQAVLLVTSAARVPA